MMKDIKDPSPETHNTRWLVGLVSHRVQRAKQAMRMDKLCYEGLRVIDYSQEQYPFKRGYKYLQTVLGNLDKQPSDAFEVFINLNNEVVVRELRRLPHYHLV